MDMKEIPQVGKTYNCFDDGKIRRSRMYEVKVSEVIPFNEVDEETLKLWKEELAEVDWLYEKKTDYFIKAIDEDDDIHIFVRTIDGGWFSIGGWLDSGRLDINGDLTKRLEEYERN